MIGTTRSRVSSFMNKCQQVANFRYGSLADIGAQIRVVRFPPRADMLSAWGVGRIYEYKP